MARRRGAYASAVKRVAGFVVCLAGLPACGSEPIPPAELGEVCGEPGPFRVLELAPGEHIYDGRQVQVGDRVLYVVATHEDDPPDARYPTIRDTTVWATGPCGESPVEVASGVDYLVVSPVWPEVVLGCRMDTADIVVLDPSGANEPRVLFPGVGNSVAFACGFDWTPHGVLALTEGDAEQGALVLHRYPGSPDDEAPAPTVLLDPVRTTGMPGLQGTRGQVLRSFDEFALALTPAAELVRVELADGAVTTLRSDVAAFEASRDGRYVLWQSTTITAGDAGDYPEGKIFLRDQSDGSDVLLAEASLAYTSLPLYFAEHGIALLRFQSATQGMQQRVYFLPGTEFVDIPGDMFLSAPLGGDRWLGQRIFQSTWEAIDLRSGALTRMFAGQAMRVTHDADAVVFVAAGTNSRDEGPVWRVPTDGGDPERLADRATWDVERLADGRLLTPLGVDRRWLGSLVLIDPATDSEAEVDEQVFAFSIDTARADAEGVVRYSVSDGERSGVYLAKLP